MHPDDGQLFGHPHSGRDHVVLNQNAQQPKLMRRHLIIKMRPRGPVLLQNNTP
jgi:hypothetical protein